MNTDGMRGEGGERQERQGGPARRRSCLETELNSNRARQADDRGIVNSRRKEDAPDHFTTRAQDLDRSMSAPAYRRDLIARPTSLPSKQAGGKSTVDPIFMHVNLDFDPALKPRPHRVHSNRQRKKDGQEPRELTSTYAGQPGKSH